MSLTDPVSTRDIKMLRRSLKKTVSHCDGHCSICSHCLNRLKKYTPPAENSPLKEDPRVKQLENAVAILQLALWRSQTTASIII